MLHSVLIFQPALSGTLKCSQTELDFAITVYYVEIAGGRGVVGVNVTVVMKWYSV